MNYKMSSQIDLLAIMTPAEGKIDRVIELLNKVSEHTKANEPGTLKYEITREVNKKSGGEEVVMIEAYKDKAAMGLHGSSEAFKNLNKLFKDEGLLKGPMKLKFLKREGGFSRL